MSREHVFITGTGTDVGKTVVTAALARGLAARGVDCAYWKPVQTGGASVDADAVRQLAGTAPAPRILPTGFAYALPASPDQAAEAAAAPAPDVAALLAMAARAPERTLTLAEGAGGLLVPLNAAGETWEDLLLAARWPTLVVASSGLGTLNHAGLTLRRLQDQGLEVLGLVLSGPRHAANERTLQRLFPDLALHAFPEVPLAPDAPEFHAAACALADFVLARRAAVAAARASTAWLADDERHVWHPYTQHKTAPQPLPLASARGVWLTTPDGERLLDGTSSWWVNNIGHGRPEIARAVAAQQATLDHVIYAGAAHAPGATLAGRLARLAGRGLTRVFFSDNGSTAVEVGLKIAFQAWVNRGDRSRTRFLALSGSYHGDTFGAMSVAAARGFHGAFAPLLFETVHVAPVTTHPSAPCPRGAAELPERLDAIERLLAREHATLAGVVVEPLVQGAAGMLVQPPEFLQGLAALCRRHSLPLIVDEVFTGFGRVGAAFAFQRAGVEPDVICVAKGLTGGNLPLAATLATEALFAAFLADERAHALLHGHSYTANPIACAAALAALDIYAKDGLDARARALEARYHAWIATRGAALGIANARALGGILAFELPGSAFGDYFHPVAAAVPAAARRHGLFLRPLGNTLYFAPPLIIADDELDLALAAIERVVAEL